MPNQTQNLTNEEIQFLQELGLNPESSNLTAEISEKLKNLELESDDEERKINFTPEFTNFWKNHKILKNFDEKAIFGYIYGLLHSTKYRNDWSEFLKTDFPRIDFEIENGDTVVAATKFKNISDLGLELIKWHILEHPDLEKLGQSGLKFGFENVEIETEDFVIDFAKKSDIFKNNKIYLNPKTYLESSDDFDLVEVYNFVIGGYQVVEKYLNSYKNQKVEPKDFMKMVWSLKKTIKVIKQISEV
jgi:predicted helicase